MLSTLSPDSVAILDDIRRIVQVLHESTLVAEQRSGVSGAQLFVLRSLAEAPALTLTELAARTRAHPPTVSAVVQRLIGAQLVQRCETPDDAGRPQLQLTERGRELLARAPRLAQDRLIQGVELLPAAERARLAQLLHTLILEMHLDDEPPVMFFEGDIPAAASANFSDARDNLRLAKRHTGWDEP